MENGDSSREENACHNKVGNKLKYAMELKLAAVRRVRAVAEELELRRKRLYVWKDQYAELGEAGLLRGAGEGRAES